jgi:DNA (cytosine-5)-methyltransferase 1
MPDIKLLDLFCSAGGCSVGYLQAARDLGLSIEITGIDVKPQPNYPFHFIQADAVDYADSMLKLYTHVHASPPCQAYSNGTAGGRAKGIDYAELYEPIRDIFYRSNLPCIIENVPGSPIRKDVVLTGLMFNLRVIRARWFECVNFFMMAPQRPYLKRGAVRHRGEYAVVFGSGNWKNGNAKNVRYRGPGSTIKEAWSIAMGIDWMTTTGIGTGHTPSVHKIPRK